MHSTVNTVDSNNLRAKIQVVTFDCDWIVSEDISFVRRNVSNDRSVVLSVFYFAYECLIVDSIVKKDIACETSDVSDCCFAHNNTGKFQLSKHTFAQRSMSESDVPVRTGVSNHE